MIDGYVQNDVGTMASCNYIPMIKISVFTLTHFTLSGAFTLTLLKRSQARWGDAPTSTALSLCTPLSLSDSPYYSSYAEYSSIYSVSTVPPSL